jgi:hypothetical protein
MAFGDFTFPDVIDRLGLTLRDDDLYRDVPPAAVDPDFRHRLEMTRVLAQGLNTEKARSEFIIAPVLVELLRTAPRPFGLFSGVEFDVDRAAGLNGVCDFLVTREMMLYRLTAPVLAVVEAKNDTLWNGFGQCIATMVAAREFNRRGGPAGDVFGCSTTGTLWKFFRLSGAVLTIDREEYPVTSVDKILGILRQIVS